MQLLTRANKIKALKAIMAGKGSISELLPDVIEVWRSQDDTYTLGSGPDRLQLTKEQFEARRKRIGSRVKIIHIRRGGYRPNKQ
ncbi:MAG: hypothetical protein ACOYLO_18020 [Ferruginibacter sp.]